MTGQESAATTTAAIKRASSTATYYSIVGDVTRPARRSLAAAFASAAVAFGLLALTQPEPSRAHAFLVRSSPAPGARLATSPRALVFQFTEAFVPASDRIVVRRADGEVVEIGRPRQIGTVLRQPLPHSLKGVFVVNWRVLSADGHLSTGEFSFAVGASGPLPELAGTSAKTPWPDVIASWLFFAGLALALGGLVSETFVWRRVRELEPQHTRAPVGAGLALAAAASLVQLILLAGTRSGGGFSAGLDFNAVWRALDARPGFLTSVVLAALVWAALLAEWPRTRLLALLPLGAAVTGTALRGHSGTAGHWWAVPADALHLAGAALWVGALAHLVLVLRRVGRERLRWTLTAGARRYARLALPTVLVVAASGVLTAFAQFTSVSQLVETGYGKSLLVKSALFALALALALAARLRALPQGPQLLDRLTVGATATLATVFLVLAFLVPADPLRLGGLALLAAPLVYLLVLVRRMRRDRAGMDPAARVRVYVRLLVAALLALFASGAVTALAQSHTPREPIDAERDLLVRGILLALALALALAALFRALPESRRLRFALLRKLTAGEVAALAGVLLAVGLLVNLAPPRSSAAARLPVLGPPPLEGPAVRLADLAGQLVVGLAATERELQFAILRPGGEPAASARLTAEAERPGKLSADLYPRRCGPGCFTIRFRLPPGRTVISARVSAPGWAGGIARFEVPWPLSRERPELLRRVTLAMRRVPTLLLMEAVTSGPGSSARPAGYRLSGKRLLATELYRGGAVDVRVLGREKGLTELAFALPGSGIWYRMWIDKGYRVRRETIVSPGHLIRRTFEYPGSPPKKRR